MEVIKIKYFFRVLNYIGFPMKGKLIRSNSVWVCLLFKIHFYVAAPLGYTVEECIYNCTCDQENAINFSFPSGHHQIGLRMVQE